MNSSTCKATRPFTARKQMLSENVLPSSCNKQDLSSLRYTIIPLETARLRHISTSKSCPDGWTALRLLLLAASRREVRTNSSPSKAQSYSRSSCHIHHLQVSSNLKLPPHPRHPHFTPRYLRDRRLPLGLPPPSNQLYPPLQPSRLHQALEATMATPVMPLMPAVNLRVALGGSQGSNRAP